MRFVEIISTAIEGVFLFVEIIPTVVEGVFVFVEIISMVVEGALLFVEVPLASTSGTPGYTNQSHHLGSCAFQIVTIVSI